MVNKIRKGRRAERELAKFLEEEGGYIVWRPTWSRWGNRDIFKIADIVAIQRSGWLRERKAYFFGNAKHSPVIFIQVKTNKNDYYTAIKKMREFHKQVNSLVHLVVALKIRGSRWKFYEIVADGEHSFEIDLKTGQCYERGKPTFVWDDWKMERERLDGSDLSLF